MPQNVGNLCRARHALRLEDHLRQTGLVVEINRQRRVARQALNQLEQVALTELEVERRRGYHRRGASPGCNLGHVQRLGIGRVADAHQHRNPLAHLLADALDQLPPHAIAQRRALAGGAQNEQGINAAAENVLDQSLQTGHVKRVKRGQRRGQGRNNPAERALNCRGHAFSLMLRAAPRPMRMNEVNKALPGWMAIDTSPGVPECALRPAASVPAR